MSIKKIPFLLVITLILIFSGCNDKNSPEREYTFLLEKYFEIENAVGANKTFPKTSDTIDRPVIESITGVNIIPEGGQQNFIVRASEPIVGALVGVLNEENGYYSVGSGIEEATKSISFSPIFNEEQESHVYFMKIAVVDEDDFVSDYDSVKIVTLDAILGDLDIRCTWDQDVDIDLYLIEPNGDTIYFDNPVSDNGGKLNYDSNPFCWIDGINEETISYDIYSAVETGTYKVLLRYLSGCQSTGDVNYSVEVKFNDALISQTGLNNPFTGTFTSEDINTEPGMLLSFTIDNTVSAVSSSSVVVFPAKKTVSLSPEKSAWEKERK